ncbi:MAG TPA: class I SAM-dependent methyltransferase [Solirubrobacteraceae bacterium]|nr:class I SAM-dependent methyltransferase [Solirubrobacteraceae bacterium]
MDTDTGVHDPAELARFYEQAYSQADSGEGARYARWRALGATAKADHVLALCARAGIWAGGQPTNTLEVGCGDGALLCELRRRAFGGRLAGVEIAQAAVEIARERPEIDAVELYDGVRLPCADGAYELGVLSHVLEHVGAPEALLAEVARVCGVVVVEVPLEGNLSAGRPSKLAHSAEIGHLRRLSRARARRIVADADLRIVCELEDPLALAAHTFFATGPRARAWATAKWALRRGLHTFAPPLARRLFTVHYACLCMPAGARVRPI